MLHDRPSLDEMLTAVQEFLDGVVGQLEGEARYHAQVSSYLLGICRREIAAPDAVEAEERGRLVALLGKDGAIADLKQELARRIRAGAFDADWPRVFDAVMAETIAKARIARPDHLAPEHRMAAGETG